MIETEFSISQQHPSLEGHFPGHPVVPGVVILDEIISCIRQEISNFEFTGIPSVKFLAPLVPGKSVHLSVSRKKDCLLGFSCRVDEKVICSGQIHYQT